MDEVACFFLCGSMMSCASVVDFSCGHSLEDASWSAGLFFLSWMPSLHIVEPNRYVQPVFSRVHEGKHAGVRRRWQGKGACLGGRERGVTTLCFSSHPRCLAPGLLR